MRRPPKSTLFPSATLSRSTRRCCRCLSNHACSADVHCSSRLPPGSCCHWPIHALSPGRRRALNQSSAAIRAAPSRSEEHTSELQSRQYLVCRLLLEKKKNP